MGQPSEILASGPWAEEAGEKPYRIILVRLADNSLSVMADHGRGDGLKEIEGGHFNPDDLANAQMKWVGANYLHCWHSRKDDK